MAVKTKTLVPSFTPVSLWLSLPEMLRRALVYTLALVLVGVTAMPQLVAYQTQWAYTLAERVGLTTLVGHSQAPVKGISPLFTAQVQYWEDDILRWSDQYGVEPNLLATVMQIESCGHPDISSVAGAQGLFQVMPFHFAAGEVQTDPDTNAFHSIRVLQECQGFARGDVGLTLACYNGGASVVSRPSNTWADETRRYVAWGTLIYADALVRKAESATLNAWLTAGGTSLCQQAAAVQGGTYQHNAVSRHKP